MLMLTLHVTGHPDFTDPQTFRVELGKELVLKPAILTRARQLTIKIEDIDETTDRGETGKHLDTASPAKNG